MRENLQCNCHICKIERHLVISLSEPPFSNDFLRLATAARFRITAMETAEVPQALQHTWSGHARTHVSEVYKKLLKQREWRLGWAERAGMGFSLPERKNPRNAQLAQLIEFRKVG